MEKTKKSFLWRASEFVKFSHTVFALPFALASMLLAAGGVPEWRVVGWIFVAMVSARTAAMAFNRVADWEIDQLNPRTAQRSRLISKSTAQGMIALALFIFILSCTQLNLLCVALSPIAVVLIFLYSLTKRFTVYSHFFLGLALSAAPVGAWAAVTGNLFSVIPFVLAGVVLLWVAGFDLIYAMQDIDFDKEMGLHSFPARYGLKATLRLSMGLHIVSVGLLAVLGWCTNMLWPFWLAWLLIAACLAVEQAWARTGRVDRINRAFFQVNAVVSLLLLLGVSGALWIH